MKRGIKMVSTNIHLYNFSEFKVYIDKFADEFILTIQTPQGSVNFMSSNLKELEELTRKMLAVIKYEALQPRRKEAAI
jgi:hypothetical protein